MSAGGWFHCSVKPVSRSSGRSSVAAAAYRSGQKLFDEQTQLSHDYTKRRGVESCFIVAPDSSPDWAKDWGKLWNAAERAEKRSNSRVARELELSLPACVSEQEREAIAQKIANHLTERYGVAVAVALHEPSKHGDERNYHGHFLFTTRRMGEEGLGEKTRELDDIRKGAQEIQHIREYAADTINRHLAESGSGERVDHRSFKERGLEQTPSEKMGVAATAMERKGKHSERGNRNRKIKEQNERISELEQERAELDKQIEDLATQPIEPNEAEQSTTTWQDKIKAKHQKQPTNTIKAREQGSQSIDYEAQKAAQSPFNSGVVQNLGEQIRENGEVKHHGLGKHWVEFAIEHAAEFIQDVVELAKDVARLAKKTWIDLTSGKDGIEPER